MKHIKLGVVLAFMIVCALSTVGNVSHCFAQENSDSQQTVSQTPEIENLQGRIIEIFEEKDVFFEGQEEPQKYQKLKIHITQGSLEGEDIIIENGVFQSAQVILYQKGDNVIISYIQGIDGKDNFRISDFIRTNGIILLFSIFVILTLVIGAKKGFYSLVSMLISFIILLFFVLPQVQAGNDPVVIAILASILIIPVTFYLSHGFEKKTTVAMVGTFIALIITGVLSIIFVNITHLSGTASEETMFLQLANGIQYNLQGLLLAGIIIGTLGVMDDITISQTAIVYQLHDLKNDLSFYELFKRSIQIGKDHIASMINTLILVYTGASMPLLLLFMNNPRPFDEILNYELITTEIVRTLVGSIGLILAVPITTYLACYFVKKR